MQSFASRCGCGLADGHNRDTRSSGSGSGTRTQASAAVTLNQPICRYMQTSRAHKSSHRTSQYNSRVCKVVCSSQASYGEQAFSIGVAPTQPQTRPHQAHPGALWSAVILVCAAFIALAGAFTAFLIFMRPVLKRMESAAEATETASKAMELSAKEFEQANLMLQAETPSMIAEIETAAKEYSELGHTLNTMTAGFRGKNPVRDWSQLSIKRVAKDVSTLTNALTPAMEQWRKRISQIAVSFDAAHKADGKSSKQSKSIQADQRLAEAEMSAVNGSNSLQQQAAASTVPASKDVEGAHHAAAAVQLVDGLQQTLGHIADEGQSIEAMTNDPQAEQLSRQQDPIKDAAEHQQLHAHSGAKKSGQQQTQSNGSHESPQQGPQQGPQQPGGLMPQEVLGLVDAASTQKGAEVINEAAVAAEKVALEANQLAADIASKSQDEEAVTEAHKQSAKQQPVDMSPEEMRLLRELRVKKQAAESIFRALERAEAAATAAATASGALECAVQEAEAQQGTVQGDGSTRPSQQGHKSHASLARQNRNKYQRRSPPQVNSPKHKSQ